MSDASACGFGSVDSVVDEPNARLNPHAPYKNEKSALTKSKHASRFILRPSTVPDGSEAFCDQHSMYKWTHDPVKGIHDL